MEIVCNKVDYKSKMMHVEDNTLIFPSIRQIINQFPMKDNNFGKHTKLTDKQTGMETKKADVYRNYK